jgi:hypothetical protein
MGRRTHGYDCMACRAAWHIQPSGFSPRGSRHKELGFVVLHLLSRPLSYCGDGRQHCSGRKCGKTDRSDSGIIGKCIRPTYGLPTSNVSTNVVSRATRRLNGIGACRRPLCHFRKRRLNPLTKDLIMYDPHVGLDDTWLPLVGRTCLVLCTSPTRLAALCCCTWF